MQGRIDILPYTPTDWSAVWSVIEPVFRQGETYSFAPDIGEDDARRVWIDVPATTFVAKDATDRVLGICFIKPT
jgi:hypothetical protein